MQRCDFVSAVFQGVICLRKILICRCLFLLQTSLQLGSKLLKGFGVMSDDVSFLSKLVRDSMELQAEEELTKSDNRESSVMKPLQVLTPANLSPNRCRHKLMGSFGRLMSIYNCL